MFLMDVTLPAIVGGGDWRRGDRKSTEGTKNRPRRILICEAGVSTKCTHLSFRCFRERWVRKRERCRTVMRGQSLQGSAWRRTRWNVD